MLRCSDVGAELDAYLDGELEVERASEVAVHLEGCPACADALAERRRVSLALKRLPAASAPENFMARFSAARQAEPSPMAQGAGRSRGRLAWIAGSVAAAAAALLVTATLLPRQGNENISPAQPDSAPAAAAKSAEDALKNRAENDGAQHYAEAKPAADEKAEKSKQSESASGGKLATKSRPGEPAPKVALPAPAPTRTSDKSDPSDVSDPAKPTAPAPAAKELPLPESQPKGKAPVIAARKPAPKPNKKVLGAVGAKGGGKLLKDETAKLKSGRSPKVLMFVMRVSTARRARKADAEAGEGFKAAGAKPRKAPPMSRGLTVQGGSARDAEARLVQIASSLGGGRLDAVEKRGEGKSATAKPFGIASVATPNAPAPGAAAGKTASAPKRQKAKAAGKRRLVLYLPADQVKTFEKALSYWSGKDTKRRKFAEKKGAGKQLAGDRDALLKQLEKLSSAATAGERGDAKSAKSESQRYVVLIIELSDGPEASPSDK
jgi:Putative zinc-finger